MQASFPLCWGVPCPVTCKRRPRPVAWSPSRTSPVVVVGLVVVHRCRFGRHPLAGLTRSNMLSGRGGAQLRRLAGLSPGRFESSAGRRHGRRLLLNSAMLPPHRLRADASQVKCRPCFRLFSAHAPYLVPDCIIYIGCACLPCVWPQHTGRARALHLIDVVRDGRHPLVKCVLIRFPRFAPLSRSLPFAQCSPRAWLDGCRPLPSRTAPRADHHSKGWPPPAPGRFTTTCSYKFFRAFFTPPQLCRISLDVKL